MWTLLRRDRARPPTTLGETLREYVPVQHRDRVAAALTDWLRGPPRTLDIEAQALAGSGVAVAVLAVAMGLLEDYQVDRFLAFTNPGLDPRGAGYNTEQARIVATTDSDTMKV